ncbi:MAG: glycosyltransferase family 4 protein [Eubacteriales bacterium]|nr:glycosyltransferase family 4 protein [Eubacteriales bacterium]
MKILQMMGGGDVGGAKTHIFSLVRELDKYHEICMVSFRDGPFPQEMRAEGIRVELVLSNNPIAARNAVLRLIDRFSPDLIHCHGGRANMIGAMVRAKRELPVMTTMHSDYKLDYLGNPLKQYTLGSVNAVSLRKLDYYQAVADRMAQTLISRGFDPESLFTIYNGMDFRNRMSDVDRTAYCREKYGADVDDSMVLCGLAARLTAVKDIATAIRGFAQAVKEKPQLRLFLAGTGEDEEKLRRQTQALGIADKVVFCGWVTEIAPFFAAMDITLLTSLSETFPYSILEGIREGCVPVCSDVGGMAELISDGETGYVFQPRDDAALARALISLAGDADRRRCFAEKQLARAVERYSIDAMRRRQEQNYQRALDKFARRTKMRDGVVLCEGERTEEQIAVLRKEDAERPVWLVCDDPAGARLRYRVRACKPAKAAAALKRAERYLCDGADSRMAALARQCGCPVGRLPLLGGKDDGESAIDQKFL